MKWLLTSTFLLYSFILIKAETDTDSISNNLNDIKDKIPGLSNVNTDNLPSVESAEKVVKEKCEKNGGPDAFENANKAKEELIECVKGQIDLKTVQEEIEDAKPTGDLDTVFGKYCKKSPTLISCLKTFTTALDPCLEEKEKANKETVLNITESLVDFLCHKDGDRIAMFIAEGGIECLQDKQDALQACANSTFGKKIPEEPTLENLPLFVIEEEQCNDLTKLQECFVYELEKCKEPTPGNIMESLFKFIRRVTPCEKIQKGQKSSRKGEARGEPSTANNILSSLLLIVGAIVLRIA